MKNYYSVLNECAVKNQVLFAGSTFAHDFPINELMQDFDVDARVYNRSEKGAKLADARDFVMEQAEALQRYSFASAMRISRLRAFLQASFHMSTRSLFPI